MLRRFGPIVIAALSACGGEQLAELETESRSSLQTAYTCAAGCGGQLGSAVLPGPHGPVTLVAWSNSPQLGKNTPYVVILLGTKAEAKGPKKAAQGKKK